MAALERDLQGVLTDQAHVLYAQLFGGEVLHSREAARRPRFTPALGARARPPELLTRIGGALTVLPFDLHHLTLAVDVNIAWKRIQVLQVLRLPDVDDGQLAEGLNGRARGHLRGDVCECL